MRKLFLRWFEKRRTERLAVGSSTRNLWHSWDPHPWNHPWLANENLHAIREFSRAFFEREKLVLDKCKPEEFEFAFCGNMANSMYVRAKPLRREGLQISVYIHPQDSYIMSQPCWEEYDGSIPSGTTDYGELRDAGLTFPEVDGIRYFETVKMSDWQAVYSGSGYSYLSEYDIERFEPFLTNIKILNALQGANAVWSTQAVYFPYLARRPYVASQSGGDMWFEASRGDSLGELMRHSFGNARVLLASNPWSFAHARRLGFRQMVYLPKILDEATYFPAYGKTRSRWEEESGGDFFVFTTSRLDEKNKGSAIGLSGFAEFSRNCPRARLVFVGWGKDCELLVRSLEKMGIHDKVIRMPMSGKARLRDYLRSADVFIDQFVLGYFGSAGLEAMACGLPVIGRIEADQYDALCETGAPPILSCSTVGEVFQTLKSLYESKERIRDVAEASACWFVKNHGSSRWLDEHRALLAATAMSEPAAFDDSPLARPLNEDESSYLNAGLKAAPTTKDYGW